MKSEAGMNIYLIGYRGTGKSTVGKLLAENLGMNFADTDFEIVNRSKKTISEIVETSGWSEFRRIEKSVIHEVSSLKSCVVATGGGAVLDDDNVKCMKKTGIVVWLRAAPRTLRKRIMDDNGTDESRPALTAEGTLEELDELLESRTPFYEKTMDYLIDTDDRGISDVCREIINIIDKAKENR
jgi:shikimate kinase